jgi:hypothetical protein
VDEIPQVMEIPTDFLQAAPAPKAKPEGGGYHRWHL